MITSHIVYWAAAGVLLFITMLYLCIGHLLAYTTKQDEVTRQWALDVARKDVRDSINARRRERYRARRDARAKLD